MRQQTGRPKAKAEMRYRRFPKGVLFEDGIALNETAFIIFKLCDGRLSIEDIARELSVRFGCPLNKVMPEVDEGVKLLADAQLIIWE